MRKLVLIAALLGVCIFRVFAQESVLERKVRVENKTGTVGSFLEEIGSKGGFVFSFNQEVPLDRTASVSVSRQTVGQFLDDLFGADVYCIDYNNKLHLKVKQKSPDSYLVTGRVVESETGQAIPGANVVVVDSDPLIGVITDINGFFELELPYDKPRIRITSIGYESRDIFSEANASDEIALQVKKQEIREVSVMAYTLPASKRLTIATGNIAGSRIATQPGANIEQVLQGNTSGLFVTNNSGMPGSSFQVKIRGNHSLISSEPAYYLDGMPIQRTVVNALSPDDIASVEIIKDASGSSIYGATAGNGVVLLKSKRGEPGKARFRVNAYSGIQQIGKELDMMDSEAFIAFHDLVGLPLQDELQYSPYNSNWQEQIFHPGQTWNTHVSAGGGNERTDYYFSLAAMDQASILRNLDLKRYTFNSNVGHTLSPDWKIRHHVNYAYMDMNGLVEGSFLNDQNNPVLSALTMYPVTPPIDSLLDYYNRFLINFITGIDISFDVIFNEAELSKNRRKNHAVAGKLSSQLDLTPRMKLVTDIGYEVLYQDNYSVHRGLINRGGLRGTKISETSYRVMDLGLDLHNYLRWERSIRDVHQLTALAGIEISRNTNEWIPVEQDFVYPFLGLEPIVYPNDSYVSTGAIVGYNNLAESALFTYAYNNRLFLKGTLRNEMVLFKNQAEENVVFSDLYPSVSGAWLFLDRTDREKSGRFNLGKVRYAWGMAGNSPRLDYSFHANIFRDATYLYAFSADRNVAYSASQRQFNEKFYWEKSNAHNLGIELGLFENRLYGSVDLFYNHQQKAELSDYNNPFNMIKDLYGRDYLGLAPLPPAEVVNKGIEWSILFKSAEGNLRWDMNLHGTHLQNRILDIDPEYYDLINKGFIDPLTVNLPGETPGSFYGYRIERLFTEKDCDPDGKVINQPFWFDDDGVKQYAQPDARAGDYKFEDIQPDNVIDSRDKTVLGDPYPDIIFGYALNLHYRQFDLSMLWHGTWGNEIFNATKLWMYNPQGTSNWTTDMWNSYRSPVYDAGGNLVDEGFTDTDLHRLDYDSENRNLRVSDFYIEDGSYLRLKHVQLGYTFSNRLSSKMHLEKFRIYLSARNLLTFTNYSGFDPEVGGWGIDSGVYPQPKTWYAGIEIGF